MTSVYVLIGFLFVLAFLLINYKQEVKEGFASAAVSTNMPACVERSVSAQRILASLRSTDDPSTELRLLISKLCCMEADITMGSGSTRTMALQFRTSHDAEVPSTFVNRCLRNAVRQRDIDIVIEKYQNRGRILMTALAPQLMSDFDNVVNQTRLAMVSFCLVKQPTMDSPAGPRDMGYWADPETDLRQYEGISSAPK